MCAEYSTRLPYQIDTYNSIHLVSKDAWRLTSQELPISMKYAYLQKLEDLHKDQLSFHYAVITKEGQTKGVMCFQYLNFKGSYVQNFTKNESKGNFFINIFVSVFYWMLNWLNFKLLSTGNIFFTGDKGVYFDNDVELDTAVRLIDESFKKVDKSFKGRVHAYMMNNVYDNDEAYILKHLKNENFAAYPVDPDMFMAFDKGWESFEDYKKALTSKYRVRLKKVLKDCASVRSKILSEEEIRVANLKLYQLYMNTASKVAFNLGYLAEDYFISMKELYKEDFLIVAYYHEGEMIAFMSILIDGEGLDVNYMGMNYTNNKSLKLYNRMLLDLVQSSIEMKATVMHLGRTATEMKSTIGATSKEMHIHLTSSYRIVAWVMKTLEPYFGTITHTLRSPYKKLTVD